MLMKEFCIEMENSPGALAKVCSVLGKAEVNILAITSERTGMQGFIHVVCDNQEKAAQALEKEGLMFSENLAVVKEFDDKPSALAESAQKLAGAKINIESLYLMGRGKGKVNVVFVVDNPRKADHFLD